MNTALHHACEDNADAGGVYSSFDHLRYNGFKHTSAMVLCLSSLSLMAVFFVFNLLEGRYTTLPGLALGAVLPMLALYRLSHNQNAPILLFLSGINFIALSAFLFLYDKNPDGSALFWFMFVPPLVVFCMSRRLALILFLLFFFILTVLLFPPAGQNFGNEFSIGFRARFMASTILTFAFFWIVEFIRSRADDSLYQTLDRLERFAFTDPLTGIGNRRDFQNHLKWILAQSERSGAPFSIALMDIDHFKRINDRHGHTAGDAILRHVVQTVNESLRETDRVFRWGGEEFALIMPGITLEEATSVAERVRRHIAETPFKLSNGKTVHITVSAGVDAWTKAVNNLGEVIANADSKLYLAKKLGRNRVCTGSSSQAVEWFPGLRALPRMKKSPAHALADFPMPMALPAHV